MTVRRWNSLGTYAGEVKKFLETEIGTWLTMWCRLPAIDGAAFTDRAREVPLPSTILIHAIRRHERLSFGGSAVSRLFNADTVR